MPPAVPGRAPVRRGTQARCRPLPQGAGRRKVARSGRNAIFAALMIPVLTTGVKREPGANPGLFLKL